MPYKLYERGTLQPLDPLLKETVVAIESAISEQVAPMARLMAMTTMPATEVRMMPKAGPPRRNEVAEDGAGRFGQARGE
ncbi:MAG: hypothetical protein NT061_11215 [Spirochaetes bacterium]|nr:hypothetical protein [Spirochaetota bacterium]